MLSRRTTMPPSRIHVATTSFAWRIASLANCLVRRSGSSLSVPRLSSRCIAVSPECLIRRSAAVHFLERDVLRALPKHEFSERRELIGAFVDRREVVAGQLAGLACEHRRAVGKEDLGLAHSARIQQQVARSGVAGRVLIAEVEIKLAKGYPRRLSAPSRLEELGLQRQHGAESGRGLRRLFSLQPSEEAKAGGDDLDAHRPGAGFRKSTASSRPSQTTVVSAGSVRATTLPARSTSLRGATNRMASISVGAAKAHRSALLPGRSPYSCRPRAEAGLKVIMSIKVRSSLWPDIWP